MRFIDKVLRGEEFPDNIDDYVDAWHDSDDEDVQLHEYLGFTLDEYKLWVEQPSALKSIFHRRRYGKSAFPESDQVEQIHLLAARSQEQHDPEILIKWLKSNGYLD